MHRLIVALLAALDAFIAAVGGIAFALAPMTLVWVLGFGGDAAWGALWPAGAAVWQFGHLVPLELALPEMYVVDAGVDPTASSFSLSLAPLGFAVATALFAVRSGRRAAHAGAEVTGVATGTVVFAAVAAVVAATSGADIVSVEPWQAVLFPTLVFALPLAAGALAAAWQVADRGIVHRLRSRTEALPGAWAHVPGLIARGAAVVLLGVVAIGALLVAVAVLVRGGQIVALFEAGNVDVLGASVIALGQLLYLPTLVVWGASFAAGPGFALGTGTAVSPAGTNLGVVPGIPVLGAVPESTSPWLLLLALLPVVVGAFSGWMLRSRLAASSPRRGAFGAAAWRAGEGPSPDPEDGGWGPRLTVLAGVAVLSGAGAAVLAALASGAAGPGRLVDVGPEPGPFALAIGVEVLVGAAILLLSPRADSRRRADVAADPDPDPDPGSGALGVLPPTPPAMSRVPPRTGGTAESGSSSGEEERGEERHRPAPID